MQYSVSGFFSRKKTFLLLSIIAYLKKDRCWFTPPSEASQSKTVFSFTFGPINSKCIHWSSHHTWLCLWTAPVQQTAACHSYQGIGCCLTSEGDFSTELHPTTLQPTAIIDVQLKLLNPNTRHPKTINTLLAVTNKTIWMKSLANEIGICLVGLSRLCKPSELIEGNNTVFFIYPPQVPTGFKGIYCAFVCTMHSSKSKVYRVSMTVGGYRLDAYKDVCSPRS